MAFPVLLPLAFVVTGMDVEKAPSLEEVAMKKRKKKSKKGVYRPKIEIDVVFKRSTPPAAKKAAATPKKRCPRTKKAGKEGLALGGEESLVVGVAGGGVDGAGGSCMEGVVLAGEGSVLLREIGVGIGGRKDEGGGVEVEKKGEEERAEVKRKVGEEGVEMGRVEEVGMVEDGTPPPKPMAMELRLTRTYLRRNGLSAKRCLDFGLGKSDDRVLQVAEGEGIAVAEGRVGEMIVEKEEEARAAPPMRKPRTKRAGLVKLDYANPGESSSLLSKKQEF